ncbi:MAG: hypothetical protein E6I77_06780 [Chloroflexi bacterium]|nr:MAG: hypothetical protein E6I77_06780 [Chloroflexota bacterium]
MWFRNVFLKTLRDYRIAIIGWGVGMGLTIVSPMASVAALISTPAQHAALASIAAQFAWNADPVKADTVGGYATFKIGVFVFIACIWPLLAASRMLRGEEDRGSLDVLLSAPRTRLSIALQKADLAVHPRARAGRGGHRSPARRVHRRRHGAPGHPRH